MYGSQEKTRRSVNGTKHSLRNHITFQHRVLSQLISKLQFYRPIFDLQYIFKAKRKQLAREIFDGKQSKSCRILKEQIAEHFNNLIGQPNDKERSYYEQPDPDVQQGIDAAFPSIVTPDVACHFLQSIATDSAADPHKISIKTLKDIDQHGEILAAITTTCLLNKKCPNV